MEGKRRKQPTVLKRWSTVIAMLGFVSTILWAPASAGCGVNFEKMKKRRVEAIRGQILSKLGMTELPKNVEAPPSVPHDIEELYNRTRDFVIENARQKRAQCEEPEEEYYAQEIFSVNAGLLSSNDSVESASMKKYKTRQVNKQLSEFFNFDLAHLKIDPDSIISANLRLFQVHTTGVEHDGRQQVELYQLSPGEFENSKPPKHFLSMKLLDAYSEGWVNFDITSTVQEWARIPKLNQGVEVTIPCPDGELNPGRPSLSGVNSERLNVMFAGSEAYYRHQYSRGDEEGRPSREVPPGKQPYLVIMVRPAASKAQSQSNNRRRKKRSLDADYCFRQNPNEANCCLRELFIDFRKDLNWKWVHAPSGYLANFCAGACPYLWSMDTQHATILSLYKSMNPRASSSPCCAPKELEPLTMMYYHQGKFRFTQMSDMVVLSCKCT